MPEPKKTSPTPKPQRPNQPPHPSVPQSPGRLRRGSDFREEDLHDAPVEDPDDAIPD
jgi:hypothetical protein